MDFNSHAHVERDTNEQLKAEILRHFNSHAHVERDETYSFYDGENKNFNSHAHVERDMCGTNFGNGAKISTHTLTWSVTIAVLRLALITKISTHTLTWSVTSKIVFIVGNFSFQLTRSRGA